jgi:hypothetical protein
MKASSVMGLMNLNAPLDLISNCRRKDGAGEEEEEEGEGEEKATKHYRDLFADLE